MSFCVICGKNGENLHHIWPQHTGSLPNSPQVWLCSSCHFIIHQTANNIFRGKPYDVKPEWWQRAAPLILRIVQALKDAETADLSDVPSRIILKTPKKNLKRIHRRKSDLGFKSLEAYFMWLLSKDLPPD